MTALQGRRWPAVRSVTYFGDFAKLIDLQNNVAKTGFKTNVTSLSCRRHSRGLDYGKSESTVKNYYKNHLSKTDYEDSSTRA